MRKVRTPRTPVASASVSSPRLVPGLARPSSPLLAGAFSGLLGIGAAGCGGGQKPTPAVPDGGADAMGRDAAADAPVDSAHHEVGGGGGDGGSGDCQAPAVFDNVLSEQPISYEDFVELCRNLGGYAQTHAYCAGANACKGLSYGDWDMPVLTDHSCKGMNGCNGYSCVLLPAGGNKTGKEIYEEADNTCSGCHGWPRPAAGEPDKFTLLHAPTMTGAEALARFRASSKERQASIIAFGTKGINADGYAFSNMPDYYKKYSRAEIERLIDHIRTLPIETEEWSVYDVSGATVPDVALGAGKAIPPDHCPGASYDDVVPGDAISYAQFIADCRGRGGYTQAHVWCYGTNSCRGLSYGDWDPPVLTDHSCKGLNGCNGYSCVDLPMDTGKTGKEIYEDGACSGCHGWPRPAAGEPDKFTVFHPPGVTAAAALATFKNSPVQRLESIVAFGTQGVNPSGHAFSNMPAYFRKYSRAEITRVVAHLRALMTETHEYVVYPKLPAPDGGVADGGNPDARD